MDATGGRDWDCHKLTSGCENVGNAKINVSYCVDNEMDGKGREGKGQGSGYSFGYTCI